MTYIPRREVIAIIPNKFEAVRVLALECRRLNEEYRAREEIVDVKITTVAVEKLLSGNVDYYDARERREQERSEAMLSAAETLIEISEPDFDADFGDMDMDAPMAEVDAPAEGAAVVDGDADDAAPAVEAAPAEDAAPAEEAAAPVEEPVAEPAIEAAAAEAEKVEEEVKE